MTTVNRTNEPTAEQILVDEWIRQADRAKSMTGMDAIWFPDAEETLAVLRANGLLSEGTPSEEQVEAAAKTMHETRNPWFAAYGDWGAAGFEIKQAFRESARAALVAAQGAARPVNGFDTTAERKKNGADSLHVAPQEPSGVTDTNGHSWMTWEESGKNGTYCRSCGGWAGKVGNRQCSPAPPTDRQKLIDEAQAFERAPKLGLSAHRELDKAILLIRRLWPALDAPLDPVKVQDHLYFALRDSGYGRATSELLASVGTRALCEAYTEGRLT